MVCVKELKKTCGNKFASFSSTVSPNSAFYGRVLIQQFTVINMYTKGLSWLHTVHNGICRAAMLMIFKHISFKSF